MTTAVWRGWAWRRRACAALIIAMAGGLAASRGATAGEAVPAGLVGSWSFEHVSGRVTPDGSDQANHATIGSGTLVKGVINAGLRCDGRATRVTCAPSPSLHPTKGLTLEAWVKPQALKFAGYPPVMRKEECYGLRFGDGRLGFVLWIDGKIVYLVSKRAEWPLGRWYHLVATYDGARMRLFVDGAEDGASPREQTGAIDTSATPLYMGSSASGARLDGVIDEVRIFSRAMLPAEIQAAHAAGRRTLEAEKELVIEPRDVGDAYPVLRKPPRKISMVKDGFLWIDAEDFDDYGGWWLDTQFVHLMGSSYLIAAGIGQPVKDATVDVRVPQAGRYRLWVRARNWLKAHSPGRFRVRIGGREAKHVFGQADSDRWLWEQGGDFDLPKGTVRIALHDLTGYYSRCDVLVLTTALDYVPPKAVPDILKERSRLTGLSLAPKDAGEYDVIVVGAGAAGSCAAIAAARLGARTALIQNRPVLGGNASIEMGVPISGASSSKPNARESGIIEEAGRVKARYGYPKMSEPFRILAEKEKNLTVFLNCHVFDVVMKDKQTLAAVKAVDTLTGGITVTRAKQFLDCTGDGWVGYFAGAKYRFGRESRDEHNESLAPEKGDSITMSGCLMGRRALSYRAEDMGKVTPYEPPPWAAQFPPPVGFGRRIKGFVSGQWWLEHPGTFNDLDQAEEARDELIRISYGYWDYIKNRWPERQRARRYALTYVPITDAKRESRRLIGDHILTQNDVQQAEPFPDAISYGGWPIDVHHPEGIYSGDEGSFDCNAPVPIYTIPYRSLYSANVGNLLFAGRCMSVTHIALGTVRVQGTLAAMGQAAGMAAGLCIQHNTTPRGLYQKHMKVLQQTLLKHDQYIPGLANEDPADLARRATVTASSAATYEVFDHLKALRGGWETVHPLNMARAVMFPSGVGKSLGTVALLLTSDGGEPREVTLHVRGAKAFGDFSATEDLAVATATVPPEGKRWVEFKVNAAVETPYVWVWLPPTDGLSWSMGRAPQGFCRAYGGGGKWTVMKGQFYAFHTEPKLAVQADYAPGHVTNGMARIAGDATNMWASDPAQPLPQWVQLAFDEPTEVNAVYLTFDTDMNARLCTVPLVPQCVRDYEVAVHDGKAWQTVAQVKGNFQRRRVHRFPAVRATKVRLTVQATNGDPSARVFEIRAYKE